MPMDHYKETQIRGASSAELVLLLYDGAINFLNQARYHLQAGNVETRVLLINRSVDVLSELLGGLNITEGGDYAYKLSQLYSYMIRRLFEANLKQSAESLNEVLALMATLRDAWRLVVQGQNPAPGGQPAHPPGTPSLPVTLSA